MQFSHQTCIGEPSKQACGCWGILTFRIIWIYQSIHQRLSLSLCNTHHHDCPSQMNEILMIGVTKIYSLSLVNLLGGGGGGGYIGFILSVCPSVCPFVCPSVRLFIPCLQFWLDPFHIHTSYQAASESVSRVKFLATFQNLNFWQFCNVDFVLFLHGVAGVSQNAGVLVVLVFILLVA